MHSLLSGINLADMAEISQRRKANICKLFALVGFLLTGLYAIVNAYNEHYIIAALNVSGAILCMTNLYQLKSRKEGSHPTALLTLALLIQAGTSLYFIGVTPSLIFWLFPSIIAVIYLNHFKVSCILSFVFCLFTGLVLYSNSYSDQAQTLNLIENRLFFSLIACCIIGLTSNYYFHKTVNYIQELYQSGIQELAYQDRLTGLANRWSFEAWANKVLEEEKNSQNITALIFLDIDNFKTINDNYGHETGDNLLRNFAKRLSNSIRSVDRKTNKHEFSIARYAGDEFMILLHDIPDQKALENIVHRINTLFENDLVDDRETRLLTFSIGVAIYQKDADTLEDLIRCADKAMYEAKHKGKDGYQFYHSTHPEHSEIATDIKKADNANVIYLTN